MTSLVPWLGPLGGRGDIWDPFDMFGSSIRRGGDRDRDRDREQDLAIPSVDWRETENAHVIRVDLPGVKKEEVAVHVEDGNVVQISGKWSQQEEENKDDRWHRVERKRGTFMRRFRLPENANLDGTLCKLEQGVLMLEIPKKETGSPNKEGRTVNIT